EGCDAVISALGPTPERADICSTATRHVIAAGARRYVAVSGAGIDVKGDQKDFVGKVMSFLVKTITGAYFRDKVLEYQLLEQSPLAWTLVRPPGLVDKPARGNVRSSLTRSLGASITRADLAAYTLACVTNDELIRKAPFVAG
ncbi:MAG TPA: NAD(P)-binding oxidoreductase, partial [Myxococcaceae bacterium]